MFTYQIDEETNTVKIFESGMILVTQPFVPETYEPFASYDDAKAWAEAHILERISWMTAPIAE